MKIKRFLRIVGQYALPGVITLAIGALILAAKGIWPFGSEKVEFFDNMQQVAPLYCHLWDWMHGNASLWFDWYTGLGTNVSMSISAFSMLSPFNLLLYFVPRSMILEFLMILTLIKMECMAVSMYAFLNYKYRHLQYGTKVTLGVMYSFSGYVLAYGSCFTPWMDIVALFPILMLSVEYLIKTGKKLFYVIVLGIFFVVNYYLGSMSLIYIFLYVGVRLFTYISKGKRGNVCWGIGIGTASGISLAAFVLVPVFTQLATSQRSASGSGNQSIFKQYISWISSATMKGVGLGTFQRVVMLAGMSLFLVIIVTGLIRYNFKKDRKNFIYNLSMLVIVLAPVISEGANLYWHFGSYNGYTLRNGYIVAFTLLLLSAGYIEKMYTSRGRAWVARHRDMLDAIAEHGINDDGDGGLDPTDAVIDAENKTEKHNLNASFIKNNRKLLIAVIVAAILCVIYMFTYRWIPISNEKQAFWIVLIETLVMLFVYSLIFVRYKGRVNVSILMCATAVELFCTAYTLIGTPKFYSFTPYQYGDYVELANEVKEDLDIEESATDRIVNPDLSLNANYPLVLARAAQSSFTAALLADTQEYSVQWGYSKYFLWLLDSGGTVFTNAMYHVTEAVNQNELDEELYTLEAESGDYKLYTTNYQLPFAMYIDDSLIDEDLSDYDWVKLHNLFYKAMTGSNENIATKYYNNPAVRGTNKNIQEYNITVSDRRAVYIHIADTKNTSGNDSNASNIFNNVTIKVNGEVVTVPTLGDVTNTYYATDYNNNLVYLGIYDNENVSITIEYLDEAARKAAKVTMGGISMDKLYALCEAYADGETCRVTNTARSLTVNVSGTGAKQISSSSDEATSLLSSTIALAASGDVTSTDVTDTDSRYVLIPVIYNSNDWTVTVDGEECEAYNVAGMFTAIQVSGDSSEITLTFNAKGRNLGFMITIIGIAVIFIYKIIKHTRGVKPPRWCERCALAVYTVLFVALAVTMIVIPVIASIPANIVAIVQALL